MKLISWNVCGLNGPSKQRILKTKIQKDKPVVIFVQETKCTTEVTTQLMSKISKGCLYVTIDARGALGGISIC